MGRAWQRFRRDGAAMFGLAILVALAGIAILGPWLVGDPNASDFSLTRGPAGGPPPPSWAHPLGTDPLHRDLLARLVHGARLSLAVALGATLLAIALGGILGMVAGVAARTRWAIVDEAAMRVVDVALAFPYLLLVTFIGVAIDHAEPWTIAVVLGATGWAGIARLARARTLGVTSEDYVLAARALGAKPARVVLRHVLPALAPVLLVIGSHAAGQMILAEAVLSYLTVGVEPPTPSWGRMLHEAESYLTVAPWLLAAPGLAILLAVLGFTRVGDGLRDALDARERRRPRHRLRFLVDVVVVALVIVVAAGAEPESIASPPPAASTAAPRRGGTLRLASMQSLNALDPALAYDELSRAISDLAFATLVTWNEHGELVGDLAERFEVENAGTRFRFWLRDGLYFHDGSRLTAADVKRSLERLLHPQTPSPGASHFQGIVGVEAFAADPRVGIAGIRAPDEGVLVIDLDAPDASFLARLSMPFAAPVCRSMPTPVDPKVPVHPCGAGPFAVEVLAPGERVRLTRFPLFYRPAHLDAVEWELEVHAATQRYRFERGEIDLLLETTGPDARRFAHDPRWAPYAAWEAKGASTFVFLNCARPPFDNRELRRAVGHALDPRVLSLVRSDILPIGRVLPPGFPGARAESLRQHDPALALAAMERAGYAFDPASGRGGYPEVIDYLTVPDSFEQAAAEIFQQQLAEIGIRIRLRLVEFATFLTLLSRRDGAVMGYRGWGADYPDPATFFEPLLSSAALASEGTQNSSFFASPELDALLVAARRETSWEARMALFDRVEAIVAREVPLVPVYTHRALHLRQPRVRGYRPHPVLEVRLREVWLAETALVGAP